MNTTHSLAEQAATRELAALVDGPCALAWYWRTDLEAQQDAGRRMRTEHAQPLPAAGRGRRRPHPPPHVRLPEG